MNSIDIYHIFSRTIIEEKEEYQSSFLSDFYKHKHKNISNSAVCYLRLFIVIDWLTQVISTSLLSKSILKQVYASSTTHLSNSTIIFYQLHSYWRLYLLDIINIFTLYKNYHCYKASNNIVNITSSRLPFNVHLSSFFFTYFQLNMMKQVKTVHCKQIYLSLTAPFEGSI